MTTGKPKADEDTPETEADVYDPVKHILQARIDDHKAQIEALEQQLADRG